MTPATLRAWRQAHTLTQVQAARLFSVSLTAYQRWEDGTRKLKGAASRLARLLQDEAFFTYAQGVALGEKGDECVLEPIRQTDIQVP